MKFLLFLSSSVVSSKYLELSGTYIIISHVFLSVCHFHFFLETTDDRGLKSYMGLCNHKVQGTKQDGVCASIGYVCLFHSCQLLKVKMREILNFQSYF